MSRLNIHPRWHQHVPAAQQMNDALRKMGDVIPPLGTPEQVAAARNVPDVFKTQELPLAVQSRTVPAAEGDRHARVAVPPVVRGVVLDLHGGGFCLGWPEQKDLANARLAVTAEVAVVSLDYRLAPEH